MLRCTPRRASIILLGAMLIVSIMPVLAELNLTNSSQNISLSPSAINNESVQASMLKLPLSFIENRGQSSSDVKFMIKTSSQIVFFAPSEVVFALSGGNNSSIVHMGFEGSKPCQIIGEDQLPGTANFFIGNDSSKWVTEIPTYSAIRYEDLYPGIDLAFKGTEGNLKHELLLKPGADPAKIVMVYSGHDDLSIDKNGSILIKTAAGNLTDSAPFCYQDVNGSRAIVEGKYRKVDDKKIGFEISNYNHGLPLVIDPLLRYSTYLGDRNFDQGAGIAVDSSGNVYVAGVTNSTSFPTENAFQPTNGGMFDTFVAKLNPAGNELVYSTYLGGSDDDWGNGIALDSRGSAYVTGWTTSTNFPAKNPYQAANAGGSDAFVARLNPAGNELAYSTYLGGSVDDFGNGITVDRGGNAYVTGQASSKNFPIKNAYQPANAGGSDAFVAKLSPTGNKLIYSTYLGGSDRDDGRAIAIDYSDNAYVTGQTNSTNFPTRNAYQPKNGGKFDVFVTKLSSTGNKLAYSTYLGGSNSDVGYGIDVDRRGDSYVTGFTTSENFPTKNPYQPTIAKCSDAFVTELSHAGSELIYSTYLGGDSCDVGYGIDVDYRGNAYVAGIAPSTDFPTKNPYQVANAGGCDVFVAKLNPAVNKLVYSTYLGGSGEDWGKGIALDSRGNAYVAGWTDSTNFPTKSAFQAVNAGEYDAFIAVFAKAPPNTPSKPSGPILGKRGISCRYSTSAVDPDEDQIRYTFNWGDGTTSTTGLVNSGTEAIAYHKWTKAGTFQVKAKATDSEGAASGYSSSLEVKISGGRM